MSRIIVSSAALYRLLKEFLELHIEDLKDYEVEIKHESKKLYVGDFERTLDVESKTDNNLMLTLSEITRLYSITKLISDQPITLTFDNFNNCLFVSDIIM